MSADWTDELELVKHALNGDPNKLHAGAKELTAFERGRLYSAIMHLSNTLAEAAMNEVTRPARARLADALVPGTGGACPDGGACHHRCVRDGRDPTKGRPCWRVRTCGPLSNVFPGDDWPEETKRSHRPAPEALARPAHGATVDGGIVRGSVEEETAWDHASGRQPPESAEGSIW